MPSLPSFTDSARARGSRDLASVPRAIWEAANWQPEAAKRLAAKVGSRWGEDAGEAVNLISSPFNLATMLPGMGEFRAMKGAKELSALERDLSAPRKLSFKYQPKAAPASPPRTPPPAAQEISGMEIPKTSRNQSFQDMRDYVAALKNKGIEKDLAVRADDATRVAWKKRMGDARDALPFSHDANLIGPRPYEDVMGPIPEATPPMRPPSRKQLRQQMEDMFAERGNEIGDEAVPLEDMGAGDEAFNREVRARNKFLEENQLAAEQDPMNPKNVILRDLSGKGKDVSLSDHLAKMRRRGGK